MMMIMNCSLTNPTRRRSAAVPSRSSNKGVLARKRSGRSFMVGGAAAGDSRAPCGMHRPIQAFTRLDMVVLVALITVLLAFIGLGKTGEHGRVAGCAGNLAALGKSMQSYVHEHGGALPAAGINLGKFQSSWDMLVFPYLGSGLDQASNQKLADDDGLTKPETLPIFLLLYSYTAMIRLWRHPNSALRIPQGLLPLVRWPHRIPRPRPRPNHFLPPLPRPSDPQSASLKSEMSNVKFSIR